VGPIPSLTHRFLGRFVDHSHHAGAKDVALDHESITRSSLYHWLPSERRPPYAMPPLTREERANRARVPIRTHFSSKQQTFLDFVLSHYVKIGVQELDREKLTPLLRLKYHNSIADAVADLGKPEEIGKVFAGFQKFLYQEAA
jgi:hypothetical protein